MPLFGSRTDVEITLDRETVTAGEGVVATIDVGDLDKKVQGVRAELGYRNTYKEDDTDSDGDRSTTTTRTDVVVQSVPIDPSGGPVQVALDVPSDAPGTAPDSVEWFARGVVDRKRGRDATAQAELTVLAPLAPLAAWAERPPVTSDKCAMELEASSRVLRPGDTVSGTLTLTPHEAIKARAVRVQLRRCRFDPDRNTDEDDKLRVEVAGQGELAPGERQVLDFSLMVPFEAAPSFQAAHNSQHWFLEGVVDVKRSGDPTVQVEVVVVTG